MALSILPASEQDGSCSRRARLTAVVSALLAAVTAIPTPGAAAGSCNTGPMQCCNTVGQSNDPAVTQGLPALLQVVLRGLNVPIGLNCDPITVIGAGFSSSCKAQPVCCENNSVGGLVNIGCVPVSL
ncbi:fungal hydrophobin-domain-containing protein [Ganoderma leucocontextum]|nr:fungal hydrophobin-domain-containing protein [Ganoderma leucocontextum]